VVKGLVERRAGYREREIGRVIEDERDDEQRRSKARFGEITEDVQGRFLRNNRIIIRVQRGMFIYKPIYIFWQTEQETESK
jgi:hypothetical protein